VERKSLPRFGRLLRQTLPHLSEGSILLHGERVHVEGTAPSPADLRRLEERVAASGFLEPQFASDLVVTPPPPEARVEISVGAGDAIAIQASVAHPRTREDLVRTFRSPETGADSISIRVSPELASGGADLPPASAWSELATELLRRIETGSLVWTPGDVELRGRASDLASKLRATRAVREALGPQVRIRNVLDVGDSRAGPTVANAPSPEPDPPAWRSETENREIPQTPSSPAASTSGRHRLTFQPGSTWISPVSRDAIAAAISDFRRQPETSELLIRWFPESAGDGEVHRALSRERSREVKSSLVDAGIPASRIRMEAHAAGASTAEGKTDRDDSDDSVDILLLP